MPDSPFALVVREGRGTTATAGRERAPGHLLQTVPCTRTWPALVRAIGLRQTAQTALTSEVMT